MRSAHEAARCSAANGGNARTAARAAPARWMNSNGSVGVGTKGTRVTVGGKSCSPLTPR